MDNVKNTVDEHACHRLRYGTFSRVQVVGLQ
jgi:hypothetical protein